MSTHASDKRDARDGGRKANLIVNAVCSAVPSSAQKIIVNTAVNTG